MKRNKILERINNLNISNFGQLSSINLISNMYVSMNYEGNIGIFLDNVPDNPEPPNLKNIKFYPKGNYVLKIPNGEEQVLSNCVRVEIIDGSGIKIVSSIIELMIEESTNPYTFSDLLLSIENFRNMFKSENIRLSDEELKGLWGELWFLKELIYRCHSREEIEHCLDSWKGSDVAKRDFRFPESKIVFEVKTTEKNSREHEISSSDQLTIRSDEMAFLTSIGVKREESAASYSIKKLSEIICEKIGDDLLENKLKNLLKERKWSEDSAQDISLLISTGIPMSIFPFSVVPTILPLPEGVTDAKWVVNLSDSEKIVPKEIEMIYNRAIKVNN